MININELEYLANHLEVCSVSNISKEGLMRASCSKYYYEIFHTTKNWLMARYPKFLASSGGATHKQLRVCFDLLYSDIEDDLFSKASLKLKVLHDIRKEADYDIGDDFKSGKIVTLKSERSRFLKVLNEIDKKYFLVKTA